MAPEQTFRHINDAARMEGIEPTSAAYRAKAGRDPLPLESNDPVLRDEADAIMRDIEARFGGERELVVQLPGIAAPMTFRVLTDAAEINAYEKFLKSYPSATRVHPDQEMRDMATPLTDSDLTAVGALAFFIKSPAFTEKHFLRLIRRAAPAVVALASQLMSMHEDLAGDAITEGLERGKDESTSSLGYGTPTPPPLSDTAEDGANSPGANA